MIQSLMLCGIGLLAGCLLMLAFFPFIHARAVRLTRQKLTEATPLTMSEIQADKDQLRAEFAMSVRRLEVGMEEMRAKAVTRFGPADRRNAEMHRLQVELDKKTALILALRAREEVRRSLARRVVKILLYFYVRLRRQRQAAIPAPRPMPMPPPTFKLEQKPARQHERQAEQNELAATAAAIAAVNLKRRRAVANKV
jgi:hypothetical protein